MASFLTKIFGSRNERLLKQLGGIVKKINALEPQMKARASRQVRTASSAV